MLSKGYSYNLLSEALLQEPSAVVTKGVLAALGVSRMEQVSGIGMYSTTLELTNAWFPNQPNFDVGGCLWLTHGSDMIAAVTINGRLIDNLNLLTDTITPGKGYFKPGTNTLTVKLDTTLNDRQSGSGQTYGLTGVELLPYRQTAIDARK